MCGIWNDRWKECDMNAMRGGVSVTRMECGMEGV